jgi:hypothetical protein
MLKFNVTKQEARTEECTLAREVTVVWGEEEEQQKGEDESGSKASSSFFILKKRCD